MNYCSECGAEVEGSESYCPECGTKVETTQSESIKKEPQDEDTEEDDEMSDNMKAILTLVGIFIVIVGAIVVGQMTPDMDSSGDNNENTEDPLTQMERVFEGDYSRSRIKEIVDASLGTFDIPINDANRRDVGDLAVDLAEESDKTEMEIIACVSATGPLEGEDYEDMTKWENYETVASGCALNI